MAPYILKYMKGQERGINNKQYHREVIKRSIKANNA
jgi:hypothetical protein